MCLLIVLSWSSFGRDRMGILHAEDRSRICRAISILSLWPINEASRSSTSSYATKLSCKCHAPWRQLRIRASNVKYDFLRKTFSSSSAMKSGCLRDSECTGAVLLWRKSAHASPQTLRFQWATTSMFVCVTNPPNSSTCRCGYSLRQTQAIVLTAQVDLPASVSMLHEPIRSPHQGLQWLNWAANSCDNSLKLNVILRERARYDICFCWQQLQRTIMFNTFIAFEFLRMSTQKHISSYKTCCALTLVVDYRHALIL